MPIMRLGWLTAILVLGILAQASPGTASETGMPPASRAAPPGFLPLCHSGDAKPEEVAATVAAAIANGYPVEQLNAQPYERISRTAAQPNGVEFGYGYTITWSYLRDGFVIPGNSTAPGNQASSLFATLDAQHPGGFAEWHAKFVEAFERWAAVTGNRYQYETEDDGAPLLAVGQAGRRGDVRIGMRDIPGTVIAYNFYPSSGSDMVLGRGWDWSDDAFFLNVVQHEHGHGLGLAHVCPANDTKLMEPFANGITRPTLDEVLGAQAYYGDALNHATSATSMARVTRQRILGVHAGVVDDYLLDRPGLMAVGVRPIGASYLEGPQVSGSCSPGTPIDTRAFGDLTVQVIDAGGNVLLDQNAAPPGSGERTAVRLKADQVPARVRVGNASGDYQMYQLIAGSLVVGRSEPPRRDLFRDGFE